MIPYAKSPFWMKTILAALGLKVLISLPRRLISRLRLLLRDLMVQMAKLAAISKLKH
jgi:hypothetical protein